jgi:hypothetical protein
MRSPDWSLTLSQQKLPCVIDTSLALGSSIGPLLVSRLTHVMEPWLTRSFWHCLDNSDFFRAHLPTPLLAPKSALSSKQAQRKTKARTNGALNAPSITALNTWERIRTNTDLNSFKFRWLGDSLSESALSQNADQQLVARYEMLLASLAAFEQSPSGGETLHAQKIVYQFRYTTEHEPENTNEHPTWNIKHLAHDALSLATSLSCTPIFTTIRRDQKLPSLVSEISNQGIAFNGINTELNERDKKNMPEVLSWERSHFQQLLTAAGAAPLLQAMSQNNEALVIMHVTVPDAVGISPLLTHTQATSDAIALIDDDELSRLFDSTPAINPWHNAHMVWYRL